MIRLERRLSGEPSLHGYLLGLGSELGLIHCFDDFEPDGYTLFRVEDVLAYERGPHEEHWDRMLTGEGLLGGLRLPFEVDLRGFPAALRSIQMHYADVIIECEDEGDSDGDFYLGRLLEIGEDTVLLHYVDALGRWDEAPTMIPVQRITKVQFDTPYLRRFMRYTAPFPTH
ncbi:hypothetical protein [Polyangium spumosum]|uniref:Uncharacterized protein n=1 Tax=Polyangium spumosum TaxID=889282 RepID=A0A6N7PG91_9BACT|nr:hypothetical protein [Polyangium spumosum]MRG91019.1 hypothetical protein [Polyangium spumosum]